VTRRLLLSYVTLTVVVLLALGVPLGLAYARSERRQLTAGLQHDALALAVRVEDPLLGGNASAVRAEAARYHRRTGARVVVVDAAGVAVVDTDPPRPGARNFAGRPEMTAALAGREVTGTRRSRLLRETLLYAAAPVVHDGAPVGAVRLTYPTTVVEERIRRGWVAIGGLAVAVTTAVAAASVALARYLTRPLRGLEAAAEALGGGDLGARVEVPGGPPELARLAVSFNRTAARLEELVREQQAFVADAGHQLRTPLAALRLRLENLAAEMPGTGADEVEGALAEVARLSRLVDGLLALARAERGGGRSVRYDAADVARARVEAWRAYAEEHSVRLELQATDAAAVRGDPDGLEQILDNLMANALEVAPAGSEVAVSVRHRRDRVEVEVADRGPGMDPEQRRRAFDRFWRGPGARPGGGSGLGLAIAARLAARDGGTLALDERPGGGLLATVALPAAPG
jgi:signal transduction histidine kinase